MIDTDVKTLAIPRKIAPQFSLYEMVPKFVSQSCLFNFYPSYLLENLKLWVWGHCFSSKWVFDLQTQKCGSGIIADEDIKQGEFVIEYVGEGTFPNMVSNRHSKIFRCK